MGVVIVAVAVCAGAAASTTLVRNDHHFSFFEVVLDGRMVSFRAVERRWAVAVVLVVVVVVVIVVVVVVVAAAVVVFVFVVVGVVAGVAEFAIVAVRQRREMHVRRLPLLLGTQKRSLGRSKQVRGPVGTITRARTKHKVCAHEPRTAESLTTASSARVAAHSFEESAGQAAYMWLPTRTAHASPPAARVRL
jgi:hypothetical protein